MVLPWVEPRMCNFLIVCLAATRALAGDLLTFTNDHEVVKDAEIVRYDKTRLIYRTPTGGGSIRLKDLPSDLQQRFGYDPAAEPTKPTEQTPATKLPVQTYHPALASLGSHPVRLYQGRRYDFSQAITWFRAKPPRLTPEDSPVLADWNRRKVIHERYLVTGTVREKRPEGYLIDTPITKTFESGGVRQGRSIYPVYQTVATTKEVLLRHVPSEDLRLPVFAIPIGTAAVGEATVEAFDYGAPDPTAPPMLSPDETTGEAKHLSLGIPYDVFSQIRVKAEQDWPNDYRMQQYQIERETKAYRDLHPQ